MSTDFQNPRASARGAVKDDTQPEAMDLADWLEAVGGGPSAKRCAALLREQHTRIAELEAQIEALSGVQALSAAPAVDITTAGEMQAFEAWYKQDCVIEGAAAKMAAKAAWKARAMLAASPTPPAEQAAPKAAPAPLSEMPYEKRKAIQEGEQIGASDAWFKARHEMLDTVDRRNVFRAGFDRGWNAALAAQGGRDAG